MSEADRDRWDRRYADRGATLPAVGPYLPELEPFVPRAGRAVDVAGGVGRHAVWLAERGLEVTLADVSSVALQRAQRHAAERGVTIHTVAIDLDDAAPSGGPWDFILCTHFYDPDLMRRLVADLAPGGALAWVHPTQINLERNAKPSRRFLAAPGELVRVLVGGTVPVDIELQAESWVEGADGASQHLARVVVRRR